MGITKEYQAIENRIFFKCPACGSKRTLMVPPELRQISTHCYKCGDITRCRLNRRFRSREQQAGKILLITDTGQEFEIYLNDISEMGVGFELPIGLARANVVSAGDVVRFRCSWNPRLLGNFRYVVKSVRGQRVGAKKVAL
jgi:hypothetical protein